MTDGRVGQNESSYIYRIQRYRYINYSLQRIHEFPIHIRDIESYTPTSFCPPPHIFTMYNNSIISRSVFLSPHSTDSLNSTAVTINKTEYPHKIENRLYQGSTGLYQGSTGLYQGSTGLYQGLTGLYHGIGLGTEFCIELLEVFV